MEIKPHISPLDVTLWPHLSVMVNNVALRLGLLPFSGGEDLLEGDYGIITQRLVAIGRSTLARGWWFNTIENYTLPEGTIDPTTLYINYAFSDTPGHVIDAKFPRFQDETPKNYSLVGNYDNDGLPVPPTLVIKDVDWDPTKPLKVDLSVIPLDDSGWPQQFTDYLEAKVAEELSTLFNVPPNTNETMRCWHELLRVQADNRQPTNIVEQNPITWQTTRRR